jgi:hypothetical protein
MDSNLPVPNSHCEVLYRQTFNSYGAVETNGLTQDNRVGNTQKVANTRLIANNSPKGILAGSIVCTYGESIIGPAVGTITGHTGSYGDSTNLDPVVGIAVNNAVGNPYESSSAVASQKVVYAHGTGTVISTDIYETHEYVTSSNAITYAYGDYMYCSANGLLTNKQGLMVKNVVGSQTVVGILLQKPTSTAPYMVVQFRI